MRTRVVLIAVGAAVIAYAIGGALADAQPGVAVFLLAVLVAHDALWMPAVLAAGALLARARARVAGRKKAAGGREEAAGGLP